MLEELNEQAIDHVLRTQHVDGRLRCPGVTMSWRSDLLLLDERTGRCERPT